MITFFQSTGTTNFTSVNSLPSCHLFVSKKKQGQGNDKQVWAIEYNKIRQVYLSKYWAVDAADKMIKFCGIFYYCWKYWHSPMRHCIAIVCVAIHDMYNEICYGNLDPEWAVPQKDWLNFQVIWVKLQEQMLKYSPINNCYKGDASMRPGTMECRKKRKIPKAVEEVEAELKIPEPYLGQGLATELLEKQRQWNALLPHLCNQKYGSFTLLWKHFDKMEKQTNAAKCNMCEKKTKWKGMIYMEYFHVLSNKAWN